MTTLHPHWQPTDEGRSAEKESDAPARVAIEGPTPAAKRVSRGPAAILGMLMMASIGVVVMRDPSTLPGQAPADPNVTFIKIVAGAFDPASVTVVAGKKISWKNESTIPHVLSSEKLILADGKPMQTNAIFPSATLDIVIPEGTSPGSYAYESQTEKISGTIIVTPNVPPASSAASSAEATTPAGGGPIIDGGPTINVSSEPSSEAPVVTDPTTASVLPRNPHTVGTNTQVQLPPGSNTPPSRKNAAKPDYTPATGPALWAVAVLSVAGVLLVTRRMLKQLPAKH